MNSTRPFAIVILLLSPFLARAQEEDAIPETPKITRLDTAGVKDLPDLFLKFTKNQKNREPKVNSSLALLPAIGYNPSYGFLFGANIVKTSYKGDPAHTKLSVAQLDVSYTTKGLFIARFRHNIFKDHNVWNFQGNWQFNRGYMLDYGLGDTARRDPPVTYPIRFNYLKLSEKVYRKIGSNLFAGMGVSFDMRNKIDDKLYDTVRTTPHARFNLANGFNPDQYNVNGLMAIIQYNTRDHPNRAYKGMYADINFRFNPTWMGSTKASGQLYTEFRKYIPLSRKNPDRTLALWYYGSYLLWGKIPYLELPGTAYDPYLRSGRAYTMGRFKGQHYMYGEAEYRFPITRNRLLAGVAFLNLQSASENGKVPLLKYIEPGYGAGLRIHFNKFSRTYVCIDFAKGRYGSSGLFFALNEAF
jgi:outer membrane protein assembly factor BamA